MKNERPGITGQYIDRVPQVEVDVVEKLDLREFIDSKEVLDPIRNKPIYISLSTAKFTDLARYYRLRERGALPPNLEKPMYGKVLAFEDIDHLIAGIPSGYFPKGMEIDNDYSGIVQHERALFVCNGNNLEIFEANTRRVFTHPLFNDVKFLDFTQKGDSLLVASSGTDCLLEFLYPSMELTWIWFAPEHGFSQAPDGTRVVTRRMGFEQSDPDNKIRVLDDGTDYSQVEVLTRSQATHINSVRYLDNEGSVIAATLFQTGDAIVIDKKVNQTYRVAQGLARPHGFYVFGENRDKYIITSPTTGSLDVLDAEFKPTMAIQGVLKRFDTDRVWLQNTFPVAPNLLALIDHYNCRVTFFNIDTRQRYIVDTHTEWKIFQLTMGSDSKPLLPKE